jgi:hypothetical protein
MISEGLGKAGVKYHSGTTISAARIARCATTATTVVKTRFLVATADRPRMIVSNMVTSSATLVASGFERPIPMIHDARCVVVALEQRPRPPELAMSFMHPHATGRSVHTGISGARGRAFCCE